MVLGFLWLWVGALYFVEDFTVSGGHYNNCCFVIFAVAERDLPYQREIVSSHKKYRIAVEVADSRGIYGAQERLIEDCMGREVGFSWADLK